MNAHFSVDLPVPDAEQQRRSEALVEVIAGHCRQAGGAVSFADYMQLALYHPALGYYSGGLQKFGERGDFITAPEVSPLFAQCLAVQVEEIFRQRDAPWTILEFGAGSGVLAAELLGALAQRGCLPEKYAIVELSAALRARQRACLEERLPELLPRVTWLERLPDEPVRAVVLANEVLDAMPVDRFRVAAGGVDEMVVKVKETETGRRLQLDYVEAGETLRQAVARIGERAGTEWPSPYRSEVNRYLAPWLQALSATLQEGVVLLIDYGYHAAEYYHPDRVDGTLMCYYRHRAHDDALWYPGCQDITAFVDFSHVAYSALESGLSVAGYTTQAAFLMASGLAGLHARQVTDDVQQQIRLAQQIKTLTLPSEMGERFKVMALTKAGDFPLSGFAMQDLRNRL